MDRSKPAVSVTNYLFQQEQIGQPDPMASGYLGTYSPQMRYQAQYIIDVVLSAKSVQHAQATTDKVLPFKRMTA